MVDAAAKRAARWSNCCRTVLQRAGARVGAAEVPDGAADRSTLPGSGVMEIWTAPDPSGAGRASICWCDDRAVLHRIAPRVDAHLQSAAPGCASVRGVSGRIRRPSVLRL